MISLFLLALPMLFAAAPQGSVAPAFGAQGSVPLVLSGDSWSYLDDGSDQGSAWRRTDYDDSTWASGSSQLGYGDGDEATVVGFGPDPGAKFVTTYLRRRFDAGKTSDFLSLTLLLLRDDGAVVYLNGNEILRDNMPAGAVDFRTLAASTVGGSTEDTFFRSALPVAELLPGENLLAVEIHQRSRTSSDISFDLELLGETRALATRGPYLQLATTEGLTLRWRTNLATDARVWLGPSPLDLAPVADDSTLGTDHALRVEGLRAGTRYYYAVGSSSGMIAGGDELHSFVTLPEPGVRQPFRIWALGDCGTGNADARAVRDAFHAFNGGPSPDLVLFLGDNAYDDGTDAQYQAAIFDTYPETLRSTPAWSTRGNHERDANVYFDVFDLPSGAESGGVVSGSEAYYSFDYANVHFVCLDSYATDRSVGGAMYTWLQADLQATDQEWIIAFWHHPPYSKGSHDSDTETELIQMRRRFLPVLEDAGVDLVLGGHSHAYERSYLIDGHYGRSNRFGERNKKAPGEGRPNQSGPYAKAPLPHAGAVYCVAGSSGRVSGSGALDHPVMVHTERRLGSLVIDVDGTRLDARFLDASSRVEDRFTILTFPDQGLTANVTTLALATGESQLFSLAAGPEHRGHPYYLLGSASGFDGSLPVGSLALPLIKDTYTDLILALANRGSFHGFRGVLDGQGRSLAELRVPPLLPLDLIGRTLYHAYVVLEDDLSDARFVSNPFPTTFLVNPDGIHPGSRPPGVGDRR